LKSSAGSDVKKLYEGKEWFFDVEAPPLVGDRVVIPGPAALGVGEWKVTSRVLDATAGPNALTVELSPVVAGKKKVAVD
jgi:hypothetical protein